MKACFADTFYYVALLDRNDQFHKHVAEFTAGFAGFYITTRWILAEVGNALAGTRHRAGVANFLRDIETDPSVKIVAESDALYARGVALFGERPDKEWSLTDCISIVVMEDEGLSDVLTRDHHFKQAGFTPVFADAP